MGYDILAGVYLLCVESHAETVAITVCEAETYAKAGGEAW